MKDLDKKLAAKKEQFEAKKELLEAKLAGQVAKVKRSLATRVGRAVAGTAIGLVTLVALLFLAFAWYSTTSDFDQRVKKEVVKVLEDATGGRVELAGITFRLWHLEIDAKGLVVHGLEGPGEAPYLSADEIKVRVKFLNFFSHAAQHGIESYINLDYLDVARPQFHLIIDKDGKTNQPVPKHPRASNTPVTDTLLNLKARVAIVSNGVALLNDRAIPFDMAARDLKAEVHYIPTSDRYGATVDLSDLRTRMGQQVEARSSLHLEAELGRDAVDLKNLEFISGESLKLEVTGSLQHFAKPVWQTTVKGTVGLKQVSVLTNVDGLDAGTVDLDLNGHSCEVTPAVAQKRPKFWQRRIKPQTKQLPPSPECSEGYLLVGTAKIHKAAYRNEYVRLHDVDGHAILHVTPSELLLKTATGYLPGGGSASGDFWIVNWLGEVPANATSASPTTKAAITTADTSAKSIGAKPPVTGRLEMPKVQPAHAYIVATLAKIPLRTIMDVTAPEHEGDLGFDTAVSGPVKVEWGGSTKDIASTVEVDGNLTFAPTGVSRPGALSNVPVTGQTVAHYTGSNETVLIQQLTLQTPGSTLDASGVLGVNEGDPLTVLRTDLTVRNLGEFDQLLTTLDLEGNGKRGAAAIPLVLHGAMQFNGTARGAIADLHVKGHVQAANVEFAMDKTDVLIDSVVADGEYSPNSGIALVSSTIKRGSAVLNVEGKIAPRKDVSSRHRATYTWDDGMAVDASAQVADAKFTDVLEITGQQQKIPVTGTIELSAHVAGTLKDMNGAGQISLLNGVAYGEPYESAVANLAVHGEDVEASNVVLKLHGMQLAGNGGYDFASEHLHGHIEGHDLVLSKFEMLQRSHSSIDGVASLVADANGTLTEPGLKATLKLAGASYEGQSIGDAEANLNSQGKTLNVTANATLVGATLSAAGQTQLAGDYPTQAKLTFANLDIGKPLALFGTGRVTAQSLINGTATVSGPLRRPKDLSGEATLSQFDVKLQGIELSAAEPLHVSLRDGVANVEQVHITGRDTDMRLSGTAQIFGATDPQGGKLDMKGEGSVSTAIMHTFDPDITSNGKIEFTVAAGGRVTNPALTGKVQFDNVNISMDGVPNGLSNMTGTLVFNQDRLQVEKLVAMTGGGELKIGGSIRYRHGVYADLTATGDVVRVRMYGLSTTANAKLKLQGTPQSALLSGNILITRFGVGADVDLAAFSSMGSVSAPPDPNSAANKIRLDVHITSAPQLDFQNSYAKLAGSVNLTVRGTVAMPTILGRIEITDGSATFAGTKYQLQRGDIYFTNPVRIDPVIDLDATAQVENYDITVGLHGTATNLKPTYRSEPPLSESDVFALLALGRTQEEAQLYQERQAQAGTDPTTSALLGGALNATVSSRVEKLFGVGSVKIDPAFVGTLGGSSARITVQQQLSRQITATFATNVNSSAQQLIQVQYDLKRNMAIVITRDESGVYSVVYRLQKRYR